MRDHRALLAAAAIVSGAIFGGQFVQAGDHDSSTPTITPIITGLSNPRGVAIDGKGGFYVGQAGPFRGSGPGIQTGVTSGSVSKWAWQKHGRHEPAALQQVWSTAFSGVYTNERGIPEVTGVGGLSAFGAGCMKDWRGEREGCSLATIISESESGFEAADPNTPAPPGLGHLFKLNGGNGAATDVSDVGDQQYQWTADHASLWEEFPDANPYGVLVTRNWRTGAVRTFVADAGANTLVEVLPDGSNHVIAYIPNDGVRDSTPTCVAEGPDGALYLGTLNLIKNGFGNDPGHSDVWRVDPDTTEDFLSAAHLWATGLTTVTNCTFDRRGNFWATEMFQPNPNAPPGDIVRIPFAHPTTLQRFGGGQLPFPGGIVAGPDEDTLFVTINSLTFVPDSGAVVKVDFD